MVLRIISLCSTKDAGNNRDRFIVHQAFILFFTFVCYTAYHMSRKPLSIVKSVLHQDCHRLAVQKSWKLTRSNESFCSWEPFHQKDYAQLIGMMEYAYLFTYAIGMLVSGHLAERINLRIYLGFGMILSGITTAIFGMGYYYDIHQMSYYMAIQIIGGFVQATGWPSVVACIGNWFGKGRRGLIMGIWNSHTSTGNILGSVIAGLFVNSSWGLSFIFPGITMIVLGIICLFFLIPHPSIIGLSSPNDCTFEIPMRSSQKSTNDLVGRKSEMSDTTLMLGQSEMTGCHSDHLSERQAMSNAQVGICFVEKPAIGFLAALKIPGVIEYSLCLFFAKLVSYTFLYWLPNYIKHSNGLDPSSSAFLSTLFDIGGIFGGILAGILSDAFRSRSAVCALMLMFAAPMLFIYQQFGGASLTHSIVLLFITGGLINGPYALITTAVSADLGTSSAIDGSSKALATVTAIIDGTGSMGAALGPLLTGIIVRSGWHNVFYMLIAADLAALFISTVVYLRGDGSRESAFTNLWKAVLHILQLNGIRLFCFCSIIAGVILIKASSL